MGTGKTVPQLQEALLTFDGDPGQVLRIQIAAQKNL